MTKGIFEGLKVVDCASFIAAPAAATVLSDFGADVIKIEPPGAGDPYRNLPNLPGYPASEHNYAWMMESRNKKSLALDLAKPEGKAVLRKLVADADVFITNFPPAVRQRLGITYKELSPLNDRLIYACFTGYGDRGEEANKPGFDSNAWWARSGLMDLVRADVDTTPARSVAGMGDHPCAMALYSAIVTGLYRREKTGKGSEVKSNLMANGVWASSVLVQAKLCGATFEERRPRERALNAVTNHYRCRDNRWIILSLLSEGEAVADAWRAASAATTSPPIRAFSPSPIATRVRSNSSKFSTRFSRPATSPTGARLWTAAGSCSASSTFSTTFRTTSR